MTQQRYSQRITIYALDVLDHFLLVSHRSREDHWEQVSRMLAFLSKQLARILTSAPAAGSATSAGDVVEDIPASESLKT